MQKLRDLAVMLLVRLIFTKEFSEQCRHKVKENVSNMTQRT